MQACLQEDPASPQAVGSHLGLQLQHVTAQRGRKQRQQPPPSNTTAKPVVSSARLLWLLAHPLASQYGCLDSMSCIHKTSTQSSTSVRSPLTLQAAHVSRDLAIAGLSAFWQPADSRLPGDQWLTEHEHHHLVPDESWNVLQPLDCTLELRLNLPGQQPNGAHSSLHVGATVPVMSVHLQHSQLADITRQAVWGVCSDDHTTRSVLRCAAPFLWQVAA